MQALMSRLPATSVHLPHADDDVVGCRSPVPTKIARVSHWRCGACVSNVGRVRKYRVSSSARPSERTICQSAPPGSTVPRQP